MAGQQALVGVSLGALLAVGGFVRVFLTSDGNVVEAAAIAFSLGTIVSTSVLAGATLPFMLAWVGVDPANAGTTVQVVMDILGVTVRGALTHHGKSPGWGLSAAAVWGVAGHVRGVLRDAGAAVPSHCRRCSAGGHTAGLTIRLRLMWIEPYSSTSSAVGASSMGATGSSSAAAASSHSSSRSSGGSVGGSSPQYTCCTVTNALPSTSACAAANTVASTAPFWLTRLRS